MRKFHSNNRLNGILWMISAIGKDRSDENENNLLNIIYELIRRLQMEKKY